MLQMVSKSFLSEAHNFSQPLSMYIVQAFNNTCHTCTFLKIDIDTHACKIVKMLYPMVSRTDVDYA